MVVCAFNLGILDTEGRTQRILGQLHRENMSQNQSLIHPPIHPFNQPTNQSNNQSTSQLTNEITNQPASQLTSELTNQPASQLNSNKNLNLTKQPPPKGHDRKRDQRITTESDPAPLKGPLSVHLTNTENECISQNIISTAENLSWSKLQK